MERVKKLKKKAAYIKKFLEEHEGKERKGAGGKEVQPNVTDSGSAKIKGPHGVIQGYTGIAAAAGRGIEVLIPDTQFRVRDGRFAGRRAPKKENRFVLEDFKYDKKDDTYIYPHGKKLIYPGLTGLRHGQKARRRSSAEGECSGCAYIGKCITTHKRKEKADGEAQKEKKPRKTLYLTINEKKSLMENMRQKIDGEEGKALYSRRMQIIEPCFANIEYCKGLMRFTRRTQKKVNGQRLLFCLVHNIGKCAPYYAQKKGYRG